LLEVASSMGVAGLPFGVGAVVPLDDPRARFSAGVRSPGPPYWVLLPYSRALPGSATPELRPGTALQRLRATGRGPSVVQRSQARDGPARSRRRASQSPSETSFEVV
jgi:hypothetical protein